MKKSIAIILSALFIFALSGCGAKSISNFNSVYISDTKATITIGMSRDKVKGLLGEPETAGQNLTGDSYFKGTLLIKYGNDQVSHITVSGDSSYSNNYQGTAGIKLGDSAASAKTKLGEPSGSFYLFDKNGHPCGPVQDVAKYGFSIDEKSGIVTGFEIGQMSEMTP